MKNIINYYYGFNLVDVYNINEKYFFNFNNKNYVFTIFDRPLEDEYSIYNLYLELKKRNIFVNDIVTNKDNKIVTVVNNIPYILLIDNIKNNVFSMNDLLYLQNNTIDISNDKKIYRTDWIKMWEDKIDYYENQINEISRKYKKMSETIDYYIGLGENAISYLIYNNVKQKYFCISHKRIDINKGSFDFYNPSNFIIDNRVRDFAEYIKNSFYLDKMNFETFVYYLEYMNLSRDEYILLISRLLFPTYYFDVYDNIINYNLNENLINNIINKTNDYLSFIKKLFMYLIYNKGINIPYIEWIIKDFN